MSKRDIYKRRDSRPYLYPEAIQLKNMIQDVYWRHTEVNFNSAKQDIQGMEYHLKEGMLRNLLCISTIEVAVKKFWTQLGDHFPVLEWDMLGVVAGESEVRHLEAYSHILGILGLEERFEEVKNIPAIKGRFDYLNKYLKLSPSNSDPRKYIIKLILFSCLIEHTSLFGQFVPTLYYYKKWGLLKDIKNIVAWTSIDEACFKDGTELLTVKGWKDLKDVEEGDVVYGFKDGVLKEEKVIRKIEKDFTGELIKFGNSRHYSTMTPDHDIIYYRNGKWLKKEVSSFRPDSRTMFPVTSEFDGNGGYELTWFDRLKIAIQADGCKIYWTDSKGVVKPRGAKGGYNYEITVYKEPKVKRLKNIINNVIKHENYNLKYKIDEVEKSNGVKGIKVTLHLDDKEGTFKSLRWMNSLELSKQTCEDIIREVMRWDGSYSGGSMCYCSTDKENIDVIERIAILAGYRTSIYENKDSERKGTFNNCFKLNFSNQDQGYVCSHSYKKEYIPYSGKVRCVTVPSGGIITRSEGGVMIAGNCHFQIGATLVKILREEKPEYFDEELEDMVRKACLKSVKYESQILDWIWENGELEGLSKKNIMDFMKNQINDSMKQMGFEPCFDEEDISLKETDFFYKEVYGDTSADFFAFRPTDYTVSNVSFSEEDLF